MVVGFSVAIGALWIIDVEVDCGGIDCYTGDGDNSNVLY